MSKKPDELTITVIGFVILTASFVAYNYFYSGKTISNNGTVTESKENQSLLDRIKESLNNKGKVDGNAAKDDKEQRNFEEDRLSAVKGTSTDNSNWVATDYKSGDIKSGEYTVKRGDTLWEIAEAVYGDGTQWHKILEANKYTVGFLPNGSQALIVTGQSLVIPQ